MLFLLVLSGAIYVTVQGITLSCVPTLPEDQAIVRCTCKNPTKNGVAWRINSSPVTSCSGSVDNSCFPPTAGYTSSVSDDEFYLEINPYSYTNCATYSCKDGSTPEEATAITSIAEFVGGVPSIKSEPGTGQNGTIEITTACLFDESDIVVNWYTVDGGNNSFTPEGSFKNATSCSDTTKVCRGTNAVTLNIGFTHTQKSSRCGKVKVEVYHSEVPSTKLEWTTTGTYCVGDDCKCECVCKCRTLVIISMVFGILGALVLLIIAVGIKKGRFEKKKTPLLALDGIGIVCDVLSLVLSAVVKSKLCCEENCEDSKCCKEDGCCKGWIGNAAIAFIVIPIVVGLLSVVIFVLIKLDKIKLDRKGGNGFFCFNNGNDDGNDGGNDSGNNGHHRGRGTNSSTVHTERTDTHQGTLSDRANSDGEVSRKDVHVQENRDNFSGRPMPPIPLTDKKGRGLSANYDDDHPMITVGIPERRAGDLGPLAEEPKKKKKKKKKQVNDDDDE